MCQRLCSLAGTMQIFKLRYFLDRRSVSSCYKRDVTRKCPRTCPVCVDRWSYHGACTVISNAERQARWGAKREAEIEALRAAIIKAELARAQAENHLLRQRVLDLETALARRESAAKSAQTQAASEVAHLLFLNFLSRLG